MMNSENLVLQLCAFTPLRLNTLAQTTHND